MSDATEYLYEPGCEHIATVTTPTWPVVHRSPVAVGDEAIVLPPILVTECVTCGERIADPSLPRFAIDLSATEGA